MAEVVETAGETAVVELTETPLHDAVTGQFLPGHRGMGGRPVGSKNAAKCLDRAAPQLARRMIARSFKSDSVLCKTMDKILPDAGRTDTLISVSLTRSDVLAELRRRGVDESAMIGMTNHQTK